MRPGLCRASSGPEASMGLLEVDPAHPSATVPPLFPKEMGGRRGVPDAQLMPLLCPGQGAAGGQRGQGCRAQGEQPRPLWSISVHPGGCPRETHRIVLRGGPGCSALGRTDG